jgi:hypothetical protein
VIVESSRRRLPAAHCADCELLLACRALPRVELLEIARVEDDLAAHLEVSGIGASASAAGSRAPCAGSA